METNNNVVSLDDARDKKQTEHEHTEEVVLHLLCSDCWEDLLKTNDFFKEKGVSIPPRGYEYAITSNSSKCGNEEHLKVKGVKDTDKVYRVKLTSISPNYFAPQLEQKMLLRVPKGVEINQDILENSGYFDDWWEDDNERVFPFITPETRTRISFCELKICDGENHRRYKKMMGLDIVFEEDCGMEIVVPENTSTLDKDGWIE